VCVTNQAIRSKFFSSLYSFSKLFYSVEVEAKPWIVFSNQGVVHGCSCLCSMYESRPQFSLFKPPLSLLGKWGKAQTCPVLQSAWSQTQGCFSQMLTPSPFLQSPLLSCPVLVLRPACLLRFPIPNLLIF